MARLLLSLLLASLPVSVASAQAVDRGDELWRLYLNAYEESEDKQLPVTAVFNLLFRYGGNEEWEELEMLTSAAADYGTGRVRNRICMDGDLYSDSVFRDGVFTVWTPETGELLEVNADDEEMLAQIDEFLTNPTSFVESSANPEVTYLGPVDYGVVSGERLRVELGEHPVLGNLDDTELILGPDGSYRGQVTVGPDSTELTVSQGMMRVSGRRMPLGFTTYRMTADGPVEEVSTRFWRVRFDAELDDRLFELEAADAPESTESVMARLRQAGERLRQLDPLSEEADQLHEEMDTLLEQLREPAAYATLPCPGPL